jgi:heptosyltransferase I
MNLPPAFADARILLVKTSSMGDIVHLLPAVSDIAKVLPGASVDWLVEEGFAELPRLHPALNAAIPVALRRWRRFPWSATTRSEFHAFRESMHAHRYDIVIDAQGLVKSAWLARSAQGPLAGQGFRYAREPLAALFYSRRVAVPWTLPAIEANRKLVAAVLGYAAPANPEPDYGLRVSGLVADWLGVAPYAVLLHGASAQGKLWPEASWIELGQHLAQVGLRCVIPWGNAEEKSRAERLVHDIHHAVLAPQMSLREAAGLLAGAKLAVGVDSGLAHLAAALGVPVVALFSGSDPVRTGVVAMHGRFGRNLGGPAAPPNPHEVVASAVEALA